MKLTAEREKSAGAAAERSSASSSGARRCRYWPTCCSARATVSSSITATDLEVELVASGRGQRAASRATSRCRVASCSTSCAPCPRRASVSLTRRGREGRASRRVAAASASRRCRRAEFPVIDDINAQQSVQIARKDLLRLLEKTHFSMAQQDVRYYLNGMLLEIDGKSLRAVATDGHRLALCEAQLAVKREVSAAGHRAAQRRAGAAAAARRAKGDAELAIGTNHVRAQIGEVRFTSKLIDGRFPEYVAGHSGRAAGAIKADRDAVAAGAAAHRRFFRTRNIAASASPSKRICSRCRRIIRSRKKPRMRSRSAMTATISRLASTSIICSMRWRRSTATSRGRVDR